MPNSMVVPVTWPEIVLEPELSVEPAGPKQVPVCVTVPVKLAPDWAIVIVPRSLQLIASAWSASVSRKTKAPLVLAVGPVGPPPSPPQAARRRMDGTRSTALLLFRSEEHTSELQSP